MAPEQVAGEPVTAAADVFALGALAVYAATGRAAFGEGPELAVMYRVRHEAANLNGCPPGLRPIAERCLAKNPAGRPSSAEVLGWCQNHTADETQQITRPWLPPALTRALPGHVAPRPVPVSPPTVAAAPGGPPASRRPRRRSSARRLRTGTGILAAIVACAWLLAHHPGSAPTGASGSPPAVAHTSWLAGTWVGAADQPTGTVTRWTAELSFPSPGRTGTFRFPTLGCSGKLIVTGTTRTTASVREHVTRNQRKLCAPNGLIRLTRSGARGMDMAWQDSADRSNVATAHLSPAR
jgi:hypothetical protein